jgi:hypothetical protein
MKNFSRLESTFVIFQKKTCFNQFCCTTFRRVKKSFVNFFTREILDGKQVLVGWLGGTP